MVDEAHVPGRHSRFGGRDASGPIYRAVEVWESLSEGCLEDEIEFGEEERVGGIVIDACDEGHEAGVGCDHRLERGPGGERAAG